MIQENAEGLWSSQDGLLILFIACLELRKSVCMVIVISSYKALCR